MVKHSKKRVYKSKTHTRSNKRHTQSKRNKRHTRSRKNKKGGALYGTGYGANCYDPNFSIYNTKMLQLFPYNPK